MPILRTRWAAAALPAAASLLLVAGAAPALATGSDPYTVELRQPLPRTATTQDGAAPQEDNCPGVPDGKDGWHFVLPGNESDFVKLTVTFEPGGQQVLTSFGPPSDKHAYVASEPGATLTAVVAEVKGGDLKKFNLSHTCPAEGSGPGEPSDKPSDEPGDKPSDKPSDKPGEEPSSTPSAPDASSPAASAPAGSDGPAPSADDAAGDLAETGNGAPIGVLAAAAAALVATGGYLLARRRTAGRQH
ncbi:LPXTG cell wall anchor domain-containing protein [Streptomyces sp. V1I6]|uniref:LPXTG cell wall anchor domain-containing protein n=1 Tax=Streptomyces sp. V1I6 TaxID=3042273 RepID=UPI00277F17F8|nr:LPXTG cell wall anchor domain-containing protein [Streptomyces sp. V1I6]MDQ0843271.1 LPXTG-motif cell wall-anchored protein [Streptomyces sp. V1I6]